MKTLLSQIYKYTIFIYLKKLFIRKYKTKIQSIYIFWNTYEYPNRKKEISKVILVECLEDINPNIDSYYRIAAMLSKLYKTKVIALVSYKSYTQTTDFFSNYHHIDYIESVYRPFDCMNKIKAIYILLKNMPFIYTQNNGFNLFVNDIDIGDLVYDEYLRIGRKETLRKVNFLFYIISLNAIYAHLRYVKILNKYKVTDIISIRDTYSHSSYCRASHNLDDVSIWKNRAGKQSSIRKLKAYENFNHKAFYFEKKHMKYIKEEYSKEEINLLYNELIMTRRNGNIENFAIKLAHSENEIISEKLFLKKYPIDLAKTTVIIYAHIFVDAVRYPHQVIFSDHYTWLIETLKFLLKNKNLNIFIKPHPSEEVYDLGKSVKEIILDFNKEYSSNLVFLDKKVDSRVINKVSDVLITGSGTIAIEAPCEGVKVITAGSSSYENTNAMFKSSTQKEYFNLLKNIEKLPNLTDEQIFNSKVGFIWLNKVQYIESSLLVDLDRTTSVEDRLNKLDTLYKTANRKGLEPFFDRLLDDRIN